MWLLCNIKQMYKLIKNNNNFQFLGPLNIEVSHFCLFQFHEKFNYSVLQSIERNGVMQKQLTFDKTVKKALYSP